MHYFVAFTLTMIEFGQAQISVPKTGIPMSKTACINPWRLCTAKCTKFSACGRVLLALWATFFRNSKYLR